jgi:predicted DNA-binding transcriptional regulator YafY
VERARGGIDRLERLTDLLLVLVEAERPLSLREIARRVPGYPSTLAALRRAFERDKAALRERGVPVQVEPVEGEEQYGYRIRPEDYFLPSLSLTPEEERALAVALAAVRLEGEVAGGPEMLDKLAPGERAPGLPSLALLPSLPSLPVLQQAAARRSLVRFGYHGRPRLVAPFGLVFREGFWYLVGEERLADGVPGATGSFAKAPRIFRVDRIEGEVVAEGRAAFSLPADFHLAEAVRYVPWAGEETRARAVVEVDARDAAAAVARVGSSSVRERRDDGTVVLELPVGAEDAFVSWVVGLGDSAEVLEPPALRSAVVERLRRHARTARAGRGAGPTGPAPPERGGADARRADSDRADVRRADADRADAGRQDDQGRLDAGRRLDRLFALLAYLARRREAPVAELARRFGMREAELVRELELAACCGLPPYTPDSLMEVLVDGDRVRVYGLERLGQPRRLSPAEGFALAAAARTLLAVPGADPEGPLATAVAKLERVLGESRLAVALDEPRHLARLREAVASGEEVEIEYFSASSDRRSRRVVEPYQVVLREGRWYLDAFCRAAGDWRRFQVDRVQRVAATGRPALLPDEPPPSLAGGSALLPGPQVRTVRLALAPTALYVVERLAVAPPEKLPDGRIVLEIAAVPSRGFLGRLLLQLGPDAEVLEPAELSGAGAAMARAALRRYRATDKHR